MADSTPPDGGFFGRWSQRKAQARKSDFKEDFKDLNDEKIFKNSDILIASNINNPRPIVESGFRYDSEKNNIDKTGPAAALNPPAPPSENRLPAAASPTLEDVAQLNADSDYSAFATRAVDPQVRNAAMRKLFAGNPHFNVMDGLDVYIDDYSVGEPIPKAMLRQMVQARALGLLDDDLVDQDKPPSVEAADSLAANDTAHHHENTDLQLQRDDAAGSAGAAEGLEPTLGPAEQPNAIEALPPGPDLDHRPG